MKEMTPNQIRKAMIEIILGKHPSILKIQYPEHYRKIQLELIDKLSAGRMVKIPVQ
jgi:hypothetical protein